MVRGYTNDNDRKVKVLKPRVNISKIELPCITINPGLDAARMWYLYEEVRHIAKCVGWTKSAHDQIFLRLR